MGEKMADGDERTIFSSIDEFGYSVWKNGERKKSQCIWGRAVAEGEFAAVEMCVLLKAAMGMPDESTIFMC